MQKLLLKLKLTGVINVAVVGDKGPDAGNEPRRSKATVLAPLGAMNSSVVAPQV